MCKLAWCWSYVPVYMCLSVYHWQPQKALHGQPVSEPVKTAYILCHLVLMVMLHFLWFLASYQASIVHGPNKDRRGTACNQLSELLDNVCTFCCSSLQCTAVKLEAVSLYSKGLERSTQALPYCSLDEVLFNGVYGCQFTWGGLDLSQGQLAKA